MPDQLVDVLLVGDENDPDITKVAKRIRALGGRPLRWNLGDLRRDQHQAVPGCLSIWAGDEWHQITASTTVWWHRSGQVDTAGLGAEEAQLVLEEGPLLLRGALVGAGVRWIDDPYQIERAENRFSQIRAAQSLGIATPATVQTNYASGIDNLRTDGAVVAKAVSPGQGIAPFVDVMTDDQINRLDGNPTFVQQLVPAKADLRIVTVNGTSWVWRRKREPDIVDWRRTDPHGQGFARVENKVVEAAATDLTAALRLTMGVSDWLDTDHGPVFLEINPQGKWMFLTGADNVVASALAQHLFTPSNLAGDPAQSEKWPSPLRRVLYDLGRKSKAPPNDGLEPPAYVRPEWIDRVAPLPEAIAAAKTANEAARDAVVAAETKANRLLQLALALLALGLAVGAYQLAFALQRSLIWLLTLLPVGTALLCLALAAFESGEIDRVGFYRETQPSDLDGVAPSGVATVTLEIEEFGRQLTRWTARNKLSDLMQARAWLTRGLVALLAAGLTAGACRAASASGSSTESPAQTTHAGTTIPRPPPAAPGPTRSTKRGK